MTEARDHERHNREFWDADADDYQAVHGGDLTGRALAWGAWRSPEAELGVLGDVGGLDVLELGCGAGQWSIALAARAVRPVGLDQSLVQLKHAAADRALRLDRLGLLSPAEIAVHGRQPSPAGRYAYVCASTSFSCPATRWPSHARVRSAVLSS